MNILKGFSSFVDMYNNAKGAVAPFGELTTQSKTFTRDMRVYGNDTYQSTELFVFHCVDDMMARVTPSPSFTNKLLELNQWVYSQYKAKTIPADRKKDVFIAAIASQFPEFKEIQIGTILVGDSADARMPDHIQFKLLDSHVQYHVTLWYSNKAFSDQYDVYEIGVFPPLPDVMDLTKNKTYVYNKLLERPQDYMLTQAQNIRGESPETALVSRDLLWHDPSDSNATLNTSWGAVIWGIAGYDTEVIKEAIRDYLQTNTDYDKWPEIYPGLYSENEFVVIPHWENQAISEDGLDIDMFSSGINVGEALRTTKRYLPSGYTQTINADEFLLKHCEIYQAVWRTMMVSIVGNPNNQGKVFSLKEIYPDYIAIPTRDPDVQRMSVQTQEFSLLLTKALEIALNYSSIDTVQGEFFRIIRRGLHYIAFDHAGYSYPVLTKYSYNQLK